MIADSTADQEPHGLVVRDGVPDDAGAVAAIGRVAFPLVHEPLLGAAATRAILEQSYDDGVVAQAIERCAEAPDAHFLVAERDGGIVGYLHYDSFGEEPELHRIYLDPSQKAHGIGSALMGELHARLSPSTGYIVLVAAANEHAVRFYARHGLVEDHHVEGLEFYRRHMAVDLAANAPQLDCLVMRRPASPDDDGPRGGGD